MEDNVNIMKKWCYLVLMGGLFILMGACQNKAAEHPYSHLQLDSLQQWTYKKFKISPFRMYCQWDSLCKASKDDPAYVDGIVRAYYSNHNPLKWITYNSVNPSADTLLVYLSKVEQHGLNPRNFYADKIKKDLQRLQSLSFDKENSASDVIARLDFYLTKAYYRYAAGLNFGFVNPNKLYNSLEKNADSTVVRLYDVDSDICGPDFIKAMNKALASHTVGDFLHGVQPSPPQYYQLQRTYLKDGNKADKRLLRINMERLRWRSSQKMGDKYVLVNIPSQRLWAVDNQDDEKQVLTMRVCCGSNDSKTPQLDSKIYRVELNPFWILPRSIIRHGISLSPSYLARKRMRIISRATGREVPPSTVTKEALMQPNAAYLVRQDNGEGNSLGRMIFRFQNNFSIFLHDTNDKNAFDNGSRDVSHGCIRVERPLELAIFLLPEKSEKLEKTFQKAITQKNPQGEDGRSLPLRSTYQSFAPPVPLFIHYYTAYPDPVSGVVRTYPDIYNFDAAVWEKLRYW